MGRLALEVALQAGMQSMSLPMFSKPILGTFLTSWDQTKKARYEMFELVPALGDHYVTNVIVPPAFSSVSEWVSESLYIFKVHGKNSSYVLGPWS